MDKNIVTIQAIGSISFYMNTKKLGKLFGLSKDSN
jgi:hypothetical protein